MWELEGCAADRCGSAREGESKIARVATPHGTARFTLNIEFALTTRFMLSVIIIGPSPVRLGFGLGLRLGLGLG